MLRRVSANNTATITVRRRRWRGNVSAAGQKGRRQIHDRVLVMREGNSDDRPTTNGFIIILFLEYQTLLQEPAHFHHLNSIFSTHILRS